jgi:hypothetical protein
MRTYALNGEVMTTKWILLICVLSLGSVGTPQAHPMDSPDIVYIDGMPCNSACQSYMAWSRQTLSMSGHPAPTQLRQRSTNEVAYRETTVGRRLKPAVQARVARQAVPLPRAKVAALQPADSAQSEVPPDKAGADANYSTGASTTPEQVTVTAATTVPASEQKADNTDRSDRLETTQLGDTAKTASAPPISVERLEPAGDAVATRTIQEELTTGIAVAEHVTAATTVPAPEQKSDIAEHSDSSATIQPGDTENAASAPRFNVARLEPGGNATADSNIRTIQEQVTAATVIAEHVVTLRDAEKAASASPSNTDLMVVLLIARPEINSVADLTGKDIAMDDRHSGSSDKVRTAIAAAGAGEVQLSEGQTSAINRLISGEVPAAVLTLVYPETGFPQFPGFKIFRIPLSPHSLKARL